MTHPSLLKAYHIQGLGRILILCGFNTQLSMIVRYICIGTPEFNQIYLVLTLMGNTDTMMWEIVMK